MPWRHKKENGGIVVPFFFNLGSRRDWMVSATSRPILPPKKIDPVATWKKLGYFVCYLYPYILVSRYNNIT